MSQINITVEEFIEQNQSIIGFDSQSKCAYDLINKARIIAYPLGDWVGLTAYRCVQLLKHCYFVLQYDLEVIREARCINGRVLDINSVVSKDEFCCGEAVLTHIDKRVHLPFQLTEQPLCFYAANKRDAGSKMRVVYIDWYGAMRDEELVLGHTDKDAVRLLNAPKHIIRLTKGSTLGNVIARQGSDAVNLAAHDKNPMFTVYAVGDICKTQCIAIYAKKKYIPYSIEDDSAVLDLNPEALTSFIIAAKAKESRADGWIREYADSVTLGKNFLNAELNNERSTLVGMTPANYHSQLTEDLTQDYN